MKLAAILTALALGAALTPSARAASVADLAINDPGLKAAKTLTVTSPKIASGGVIPEVYSAYGKGVAPPLHWSNGPYGTRSYALIVEDPDAPLPTPFIHWMAWNLSAGGLPEGGKLDGMRQGKLMFVGTVGYMGPRPPPGAPHHYHFQVFALDTAPDLPDGAERAQLAQALKGHVLASGELVATFQKP